MMKIILMGTNCSEQWFKTIVNVPKYCVIKIKLQIIWDAKWIQFLMYCGGKWIPFFYLFFCKKKQTESKLIWNISSIIQVGSLAALHLAKKGHDIHLYEYREGNFSQNMVLVALESFLYLKNNNYFPTSSFFESKLIKIFIFVESNQIFVEQN